MIRSVCLALVALCVVGSAWSQDTRKPFRVDTAPVSERFPAEWYPPADDTFVIYEPVQGKPYRAARFERGTSSDPALRARMGTEEGGGLVARDSHGRTRTELPLKRRTASGQDVPVKLVVITDPVSHCELSWDEPWVKDATPTVFYRCNPRTLRVEAMQTYKPPTAAGPTQDGATVVTEEILPEKTLQGVAVTGHRTTMVTQDPDRTDVIELWYSEALEEPVLLLSKTSAATKTGFESMEIATGLTEIVPGEPDDSLFHAPSGYIFSKRKD